MTQKKHNLEVVDLKTRLDKFLAEQVEDLSRSKIQRDIEAGAVKVNKEKIDSPKFVVRSGDKVEYKPIKEKEPGPVNLPLHILHNQDGLLVLDKPAGLAVHPGAGLKEDSLSQALQFHYPEISVVGEPDRPGIVHRLDKETSGIMAVALNQEMYLYLKEAFAEHKIGKKYLALVCGHIGEDSGLIQSPVGKSQRDFRKYTTDTSDMVREKTAKTEYQVVERLVSKTLDEYTLIVVKLHTGRTHQIRVHFNSLCHPLVGDSLYGGKQAQKLGFNRQALHAFELEIPLPDGELLSKQSKLPQDLRELLVKLNSQIVANY
ncbi:MAG: RluA family pseudouridine synthase [Candidatus Doudnabacteria bacterium]